MRRRAAIAERLERIYELLPKLRELRDRPAGQTSGGEQQMVAIGRALMAEPRLLAVDELSLGLAPLVVESLAEFLLRSTRRRASRCSSSSRTRGSPSSSARARTCSRRGASPERAERRARARPGRAARLPGRRPGGLVTEFLQYVVVGLSTGAAFALVGIGMVLIFRTTGIVNFAQGAFAVMGGLFMVELVDELPFVVAGALVRAAGRASSARSWA